MVKLIRQTFSIITKQQTNIFSAATVIMTTVALSRILGLLRDRLLAGQFTPDELGVYYAAFRLPNMVFEMLVMGALATAFIPVFTTHMDKKGKEAAYMTAASVINIGCMAFFLFCIPLVLFTRPIAVILAPGFNAAQIDQMVIFTRIMLVAQVAPLLIGNFLTGMLQSMRNFLIPSLAPVVYNIGIILCILMFSDTHGLYAPVYGVVLGAILFLLIQIPAVWSFGYRHTMWYSFKDPGTREVGKLMLPRTISLAVSQIDITIDLILSSLLGAGAVTIFNFAQHLQQVPVGLFGSSIAQATLPSLSSAFAQEKLEEFKHIFLTSFLHILFFVLPLSVTFIVLRIPLVRLVFGASNLFDWNATVITGKTLAFFSISLFAQSQIHLITRSFFALHDSKTPFYIGTITVVLNTILSLWFILVKHLDVSYLGLSTSIAHILQMIVLLVFLDRKVRSFNRYQLIVSPLKIFLCAAVAGVALYIPIKLLDQLVFDTTRTFNLLLLTGISTTAGFLVYLFLAWFLEVPQMNVVFSALMRAKPAKQSIGVDTAQEMNQDVTHG